MTSFGSLSRGGLQVECWVNGSQLAKTKQSKTKTKTKHNKNETKTKTNKTKQNKTKRNPITITKPYISVS